MASRQFTNSVAANLAYWNKQLTRADSQHLRSLTGERHNLFRAVEFGLDLSETWSASARLIIQAHELITQHGYWHECIPLVERLFSERPDHSRRLHADLLNEIGTYYQLSRQTDPAEQAHTLELNLANELDMPYLAARAHSSLTKVYWQKRQYDLAESHGLSALEGYEAVRAEPKRIGSIYMTLGLIKQARGDLTISEANLRLAVDHFRRIDMPVELARALNNLGNTLAGANKDQEALSCYIESKMLLAKTENELDKMLVELSLGTLYFNQGRLEQAETAYRRADSPYTRYLAQPYHRAQVASNLGVVYQAQGKLSQAESYLRNAIDIWREADAHLMLANTLGDLAEILHSQGDSKSAGELYDEAIIITAEYPDDAWGRQLNKQFAAAVKNLHVN